MKFKLFIRTYVLSYSTLCIDHVNSIYRTQANLIFEEKYYFSKFLIWKNIWSISKIQNPKKLKLSFSQNHWDQGEWPKWKTIEIRLWIFFTDYSSKNFQKLRFVFLFTNFFFGFGIFKWLPISLHSCTGKNRKISGEGKPQTSLSGFFFQKEISSILLGTRFLIYWLMNEIS